MDHFLKIKEDFNKELEVVWNNLYEKVNVLEEVLKSTESKREELNKLNKDITITLDRLQELLYNYDTLKVENDALDKVVKKNYIIVDNLEQKIKTLEATYTSKLDYLQKEIKKQEDFLKAKQNEIYPLMEDIVKREAVVARKEKDLHIIESRWKKKYAKIGANFTL